MSTPSAVTFSSSSSTSSSSSAAHPQPNSADRVWDLDANSAANVAARTAERIRSNWDKVRKVGKAAASIAKFDRAVTHRGQDGVEALQSVTGELEVSKELRSLQAITAVDPHARTSEQIDTIVDQIIDVEFFRVLLSKGMTVVQLRELCRNMVVMNLARDDIVFEEGDIGLTFYVIISGKVGVYVRGSKADAALSHARLSQAAATEASASAGALVGGGDGWDCGDGENGGGGEAWDGDEEGGHRRRPRGWSGETRQGSGADLGKQVADLREGQWFGEIALMDGRKTRSASVVTQTRATLLAIHKSDYERVLKQWHAGQYTDRVEQLSHYGCLEGLSADDLNDLAYVASTRKYHVGDLVIKEGDPIDHDAWVMLINRGECSVIREVRQVVSGANSSSSSSSSSSNDVLPTSPRRGASPKFRRCSLNFRGTAGVSPKSSLGAKGGRGTGVGGNAGRLGGKPRAAAAAATAAAAARPMPPMGPKGMKGMKGGLGLRTMSFRTSGGTSQREKLLSAWMSAKQEIKTVAFKMCTLRTGDAAHALIPMTGGRMDTRTHDTNSTYTYSVRANTLVEMIVFSKHDVLYRIRDSALMTIKQRLAAFPSYAQTKRLFRSNEQWEQSKKALVRDIIASVEKERGDAGDGKGTRHENNAEEEKQKVVRRRKRAVREAIRLSQMKSRNAPADPAAAGRIPRVGSVAAGLRRAGSFVSDGGNGGNGNNGGGGNRGGGSPGPLGSVSEEDARTGGETSKSRPPAVDTSVAQNPQTVPKPPSASSSRGTPKPRFAKKRRPKMAAMLAAAEPTLNADVNRRGKSVVRAVEREDYRKFVYRPSVKKAEQP